MLAAQTSGGGGQMNQIAAMRGQNAPLPNAMQGPQQQPQMSGMGPGINMNGGQNPQMSPVQPTSIPQGMMSMGMGNSMGSGMSGMSGSMGGMGGGLNGMGGSMSGVGGGMGGIDPRMMNSGMGGGAGGVGGGSSGMTAQQRQQLALLQQQRVPGGMQGGGGGNGPSGMGGGMGGAGQFGGMGGQGGPGNPMQQHILQERMRQQAAQMGGAPSPTHANSPLGSDGGSGGFPGGPSGAGMRNQASIPGISRSARSPTDSPMGGRGPPGRIPSMGQEDYQRMLAQQQQGQMRQVSSSSPANFNPQMMGGGPSQQLAAQMHQQGFSMSPQSSQFGGGVGGMTSASPTNGQQNWGTSQGAYPFTGNDQRQMSVTPLSNQQTQMSNQASPTDLGFSSELDLFTWNG